MVSWYILLWEIKQMKDIRTIRMIRGKTLAEVANAVGISKQRYSQIERKHQCGSEAVARKIAAYFGFSIFEMLGDDVLKIKPQNKEEQYELMKHVLRKD